jgi:hypothetical protein
MFAVVAFVVLVYVYSLISRRLEETILSISLVYTMVGLVLSLVGPVWS